MLFGGKQQYFLSVFVYFAYAPSNSDFYFPKKCIILVSSVGYIFFQIPTMNIDPVYSKA